MNLDQFIKQYNGKFYDYDGSYPNQCVDIVKKWESVNGWPVVNGNARLVPKNAPKSAYDWTGYTKGLKPDPGDIVVFEIGVYGHIGVCVNADPAVLTCFEQNYPLRSPCHLVRRPGYIAVRGWLKHKGNIMNPEQVKNERMNARADAMRYAWKSWNNAEPDMNSIYAEARKIEDNQLNQEALIMGWRDGSLKAGIYSKNGQVDTRLVQAKVLADQIKNL